MRPLILAAALAAATLAAPATSARDLTVVSWGGAYQDAQREVYFRPFTQSKGTALLEETWDGGVGVLRASEPVEKRYLFMKDGPAPVYAYSAFAREGKLEIANNHEQGLEQIYLRPYEKDGAVWLRITLVAYERIVDLLEVEVKLPEDLGARIKRASAGYTRPLWRSFSDSNIL